MEKVLIVEIQHPNKVILDKILRLLLGTLLKSHKDLKYEVENISENKIKITYYPKNIEEAASIGYVQGLTDRSLDKEYE